MEDTTDRNHSQELNETDCRVIYCVPDDIDDFDNFDDFDENNYELDMTTNNVANAHQSAIYHSEGDNLRNSDRNNYKNDGKLWELQSSNGKKINEESVQNQRMDIQNNDSHKNQESENKIEDSQYQNQNVSCTSNHLSDLISERTKFRLEKLVDQHTEGIWISDLPDMYFKEYNITLDYVEMGFSNITQLVHALPKIFHCTQPVGKNRIMVLSTKHLSNKPAQKTTLAAVYSLPKQIIHDVDALPNQLSDEIIERIMPSTAMRIAEQLEEISVTELKTSSRGYEEVIVCEIFHPSFFWVQLRNRKQMFDKLMDDLHSFYTRESHHYSIPTIAHKKGLHIACKYGNKWHRGVIAKIKSDGYVIVFFCDYGTVKTYNPSQLYYLHKSFAYLQAQAIPCGMYNLRPSKVAKWPQAVIDAFTKKVSLIPLIASIFSIDIENNSMLISLTDTSDDENDLHISDWLIENKYAELGSMCATVPVKDICYYDEDLLIKRAVEERKIEAEKRRTEDQNFNECQEKHSPLHGSTRNASACCCHSSSVVPFTITDLDIYHTNIKLMERNIELKANIKEMHDIVKLLTLKLDAESIDNLKGQNSNFILEDSVQNEKLAKQWLSPSVFDTITTDEPLNIRDRCRLNKDKFSKCLQNVPEVARTFLDDVSEKSNVVAHKVVDVSRPDHPTSSTVFSNGAISPRATSSNPFHDNYEESSIAISVTNNNSSECKIHTNPFRNGINDIYDVKENHGTTEIIYKHTNENFQESQRKLETTSHNIKPEHNINHTRKQKLQNVQQSYCNDFDTIISNIPTRIVKHTSDSVSASKKIASNFNMCQQDQLNHVRPPTAIDNSNGYSYTNDNNANKSLIPITENPENISLYLFTYELTMKERPIKYIHVLVINNEAWMCINEFVDAFTHFENPHAMLESLKTMYITVKITSLTRTKYPEVFAQLDKSEYYGYRDSKYQIQGPIEIISLREVLHLLVILKIVDIGTLKKEVALKKESPNYVKRLHELYDGTVLCDLLMLLLRTREFLKNRNNTL